MFHFLSRLRALQKKHRKKSSPTQGKTCQRPSPNENLPQFCTLRCQHELCIIQSTNSLLQSRRMPLGNRRIQLIRQSLEVLHPERTPFPGNTQHARIPSKRGNNLGRIVQRAFTTTLVCPWNVGQHNDNWLVEKIEIYKKKTSPTPKFCVNKNSQETTPAPY